MAQQPVKVVKVPLQIIQALVNYLDEKPHKEVRPFIDVLSSLPTETELAPAKEPAKPADPPKE